MSQNIISSAGEPYLYGKFSSSIFSIAKRSNGTTAKIVSEILHKPIYTCLAYLETLCQLGFLKAYEIDSSPEDRKYMAIGSAFAVDDWATG